MRCTLSNEKYLGNALLQKKYRNNHIDKKLMPNRGELPMYYAEGTHEPIIDQVTFNKAQERLRIFAQQTAGRKKPTRSAFSGLIRCGLCGNSYKRVVYCNKHFWNCITFQTKGKLMQATLTDCTGIDTEIKTLLEEIDVVTELTKRCIAENSQTAQNQEEYAARYNGFVERYEKAKARLEQLRTTKTVREAKTEAIGAFMFEVQELDALTEFDEKLWLTVIDTVTVHTDGRMTFKFHGGTVFVV